MDTELKQDGEDALVITKVEKPKISKKMTTWVSSSFDDFMSKSQSVKPITSSLSHTTSRAHSKSNKTGLTQSLLSDSLKNDASRKRPIKVLDSQSSFPTQRVLNSNIWTEVYRPNSRTELAVHKKKIEEIDDWLSQSLHRKFKHKAPILVLCGPPGAGKTACINVLCQEMDVSIQQWENTSSQQSGEDFKSLSAQQEYSKVDVYTSQSQGTLFNNFLLRANKYSPLAGICSESHTSHSKGDKKAVILVEELPNIFLRDNTQFHTILRKYHRSGQSPLVFIVTESNSSGSSMQKLFPKDLQNELHMTQINVNPVAPTMMTKCLNKVVLINSGQKNFHAPSHFVLETIAQGSAGDLRAAFNMLQFACSKKESLNLNELQDVGKKIQRKGSVSSKYKNKHKSSDDSQSVVGVKDTSVFLFHAVGKILYFKRGNPVDFPEHPKVPTHLSSHDRDPLLLDPEEVVSKVHISSDYFNSFLHENYVNFVNSVEDLERASEYFSHADAISSVWTARDDLENYSLSLTTRGFIHSNSAISRYDSVRKNYGWHPLHKSQWFPAIKQATQNKSCARQLFRSCHWEPEILCTELIPYIHLTNPTLHDPEQISFVHQMTQFSSGFSSSRRKVEQLNEKEAVDEDEEKDTDLTYNKMNQTTISQGRDELQSNELQPKSTNEILPVDESEWGSDWEADDADLLGSQNQVNAVSEEDVMDFVIEEFDD